MFADTGTVSDCLAFAVGEGSNDVSWHDQRRGGIKAEIMEKKPKPKPNMQHREHFQITVKVGCCSGCQRLRLCVISSVYSSSRWVTSIGVRTQSTVRQDGRTNNILLVSKRNAAVAALKSNACLHLILFFFSFSLAGIPNNIGPVSK